MKELLYLKDDQLKDLIEKLFLGYRETFSDSKKILVLNWHRPSKSNSFVVNV